MKLKCKSAVLLFSGLALSMIMATPVFASDSTTVNDDTLLDKTIPVSVTGQKVDGNATVVDYTYSGEKEFYTIISADDSVYYLVIDNEKDSENVYFLRNINDSDLTTKNNVSASELACPETPATDEKAESEAPTKNNSSMLLMLLALAGFGGGAYYFKILKPKQAKANTTESELDELDLMEDIEDELEFSEQDGEEISEREEDTSQEQ